MQSEINFPSQLPPKMPMESIEVKSQDNATASGPNKPDQPSLAWKIMRIAIPVFVGLLCVAAITVGILGIVATLPMSLPLAIAAVAIGAAGLLALGITESCLFAKRCQEGKAAAKAAAEAAERARQDKEKARTENEKVNNQEGRRDGDTLIESQKPANGEGEIDPERARLEAENAAQAKAEKEAQEFKKKCSDYQKKLEDNIRNARRGDLSDIIEEVQRFASGFNSAQRQEQAAIDMFAQFTRAQTLLNSLKELLTAYENIERLLVNEGNMKEGLQQLDLFDKQTDALPKNELTTEVQQDIERQKEWSTSLRENLNKISKENQANEAQRKIKAVFCDELALIYQEVENILVIIENASTVEEHQTAIKKLPALREKADAYFNKYSKEEQEQLKKIYDDAVQSIQYQCFMSSSNFWARIGAAQNSSGQNIDPSLAQNIDPSLGQKIDPSNDQVIATPASSEKLADALEVPLPPSDCPSELPKNTPKVSPPGGLTATVGAVPQPPPLNDHKLPNQNSHSVNVLDLEMIQKQAGNLRKNNNVKKSAASQAPANKPTSKMLQEQAAKLKKVDLTQIAQLRRMPSGLIGLFQGELKNKFANAVDNDDFEDMTDDEVNAIEASNNKQAKKEEEAAKIDAPIAGKFLGNLLNNVQQQNAGANANIAAVKAPPKFQAPKKPTGPSAGISAAAIALAAQLAGQSAA